MAQLEPQTWNEQYQKETLLDYWPYLKFGNVAQTCFPSWHDSGLKDWKLERWGAIFFNLFIRTTKPTMKETRSLRGSTYGKRRRLQIIESTRFGGPIVYPIFWSYIRKELAIMVMEQLRLDSWWYEYDN